MSLASNFAMIDNFTANFAAQLPANDNIVFSPLSISLIFSILANTSIGKTHQEIRDAFSFGPGYADAFTKLMRQVKEERAAGSEVLSIANKILFAPSLSLHPDLNALLANYDAEQEQINFASPQLTSRVNDWVKEKTNGKISELIDGQLSPDTIGFLMNAIYFNNTWAAPFDTASPDRFRNIDGTSTYTRFMEMEDREYGYLELNGERPMQIVRIPYNGDTSMYVFLPRDIIANPFELLETPLETVLQQVQDAYVDIYLPKFSHTSKIELVDVLKRMGISTAFSRDAQFPGFSNQAVYFDDGVHKATIDVTEKGTVAAAATGLKIYATSARFPIIKFRANRPFSYIIRDTKNNVNLFTGFVRKF